MKAPARDIFERARVKMVENQIAGRGVTQAAVLAAMGTVPRHLFVDEALYSQAYSDWPLPIGEQQTISQPYMVGYMSEALGLKGTEKVLEVGTGSGYQTAVLSLLADMVFTVERIPSLATRARKLFDTLDITNVQLRVGDGTTGWSDEAPFDAVIVTAASPTIPPAYTDQLKDGGRLVIPVGEETEQELIKITRSGKSLKRKTLVGCRFVKLVGKYGWEAAT